MDYDKTEMAQDYDSGRSYSPEQLNRWLDIVSHSIGAASVRRVLDLGCGTCRYSHALAKRLNAFVVGLEPSSKMLSEAKKKPSEQVALVRGCGESLPFANEAIDVVFISMVFHHFQERDAAARECRRVLRAGGSLCLRAGTVEQIERYAYVPFFPEARPLIERSLTSRAEIESTFPAAGLKLVTHRLVRSEAASSWPEYARRLGHRADSILVQLSDSEFERGLQALSGFAIKGPAGPVVEPVDFFVFRKS
jgi:ubiquinone/menaquinone biosynthesis C-methylase UbiE